MNKTTLITIPFSHFCEKSRWMLDLAGIAYSEDAHLPILHRFATKKHGGKSVPLLVTPDQVFRDSTDILQWVDLQYPLLPTDPELRNEAMELESDFDRVLGPHIRRVMYFHLLKSRDAMSFLLKTAPRWEARLGRLGLGLFKLMLTRSLKLTPEGCERSLVKVRQTFAGVSARLSNGRAFLVGDAISAADMAFAALASPILMPAEHPIAWPPETTLPPAIIGLRDELRQTPAGQFGLRLYRNHRLRHRA